MITKIENFIKPYLKSDLPDIRPGDTVRLYQKIPATSKNLKGKNDSQKEKFQIFEGLVIARKHGKEMGATITLRKIISGIGVERIFPLHSPSIEKIEVLKRGKVRRAKLYYLRKLGSKKMKLKKIAIAVPEEKPDNKLLEEKNQENLSPQSPSAIK